MRSVKRYFSVGWTSFSSSLILFTFVAGLLASSQALAVVTTLNEYFCADDIKNVGNCTANEVSLSGVTGVVITDVGGTVLTSCYDGQIVKIANLDAELDNNTGQRWDIAFWIGRYGNDPRTPAGNDPTACAVTSLPDDGTGAPWIADEDGDNCWDFAVPLAPVPLSFGGGDATYECRDSNNDGIADLQVLTTWQQSADAQNGHSCGVTNLTPPFDINEPVFEPGAPSKCDITVLDTVPIVQVASLTITKVSQGGDGIFAFTPSGFPAGSAFENNFNLDTTAPAPGIASLTDAAIILIDPVIGDTFTVNETPLAGFTLVDASCSNGDDPTIGVTLTANDDVTCTFTNVAEGSVTIVKNTIGGDATFNFTSTTLPIPASFNIMTVGGTGSASTLGINVPGTYNATETPLTGWDLTDLSCVDPTGGTTWDIDTGSVSIDWEAGDTITCTYENTKRGEIRLFKTTTPSSTDSFEFTHNVIGTTVPASTFNLNAGSQQDFLEVEPGSYTITESDPTPTYDLNDIVCLDGFDNEIDYNVVDSVVNVGTRTATINVDPGEIVACEFFNVKRGNLTVVKQLSAIGPATMDFDFTSTALGPFTLSPTAAGVVGEASTTFTNIVSNFYDLAETDPSADGWELVSALCDDGTNLIDPDAANPGEVFLADGNDLTCTFINAPLGSSTIIKNTIGGTDGDTFVFTGTAQNGETNPMDGLNLIMAGGTDTMDFSYQLSPNGNPFTVTEDPIPAGWDLTNIECSEDGTQDSTVDIPGATASINVDLAEAVTCTFTNTADASLVIQKATVPAGLADSFTFTSDGVINWDGSAATTTGIADGGSDSQTGQPGLYEAHETVPAGFKVTDISCSGETLSTIQIGLGTPAFEDGDDFVEVTLAAGETVTCAFENTALGSIQIVKDTLGGDGTFQFNSPQLGGFPLTTIANTANTTFSNLLPGDYMIGEIVTAGWDLTDLTCVGETGTTYNYTNPSVTVSLLDGENIVCTFTNTQQATLIVEKLTDPDTSTQGFSFTGDVAGGPILHGQTLMTENVSAGASYTSTETPVAGWDLTDITCDDDQSAVPSTGDIATGIVTFNADPGETITCTFTNTIQRGNIIVEKVTDPVGSAQEFFFVPSWDAAFLLADGANKDSGPLLPSSESSVTYSVTETLPTGWDQTSATCDDGSSPSAIDLAPGETVTCTFTNTIQRGNIVVDKVTDPFGSTQSFDFTSNYGGPFSLTNAAVPNDSGPLVPSSENGTYNVSEAMVAGWDQTSAVCTGTGNTPASITLLPGETVTCTFTNTVQRGNIVVDKVTDPTGSTQSFDFTTNYGNPFALTDAALPNDSGAILPSSEAGTYNVSEAMTAGWDQTSATCTGQGNTPAAITLQPGETVTCTFTNTIQAAQIIVDKQTAPAGSPVLFDFTLTGTGVNQTFQLADATTSYNSGDLLPMSENGPYNVAETLPADWSEVSATCSDGSDPAAVDLNPGEIVTCTFVNAQAGQSTFTKLTIGGDDTFMFTSTAPSGDFSLTTSGGTSPTASTGMLDAGSYTITEQALAGWDLTDMACIESDTQDTVIDIPNRTITLNVQEGETINCTVTNTKLGSITVSKVTVPTGDPTMFAFTGDVAGSIADGGTIVVSDLSPGTYTSVEGVVADWDLTDITCDDGVSTTPSTGDIATLTATFNLDAGEDVICTFTNTLQESINLAKIVNGAATLEADGTYTVVYTITATSTGGPGTYDLVDAFSPGAGITLNTATALYVAGTENAQTGTLGAYPNFVTDEDLGSGLNESWTVTANFTVDPALTDPVSSVCATSGSAVNTGFYNLVTGSATDTDLTDNDACTDLPQPGINLAKTVNGPAVRLPGGTYTVVYTITASNTGGGPGVYDLIDAFTPGVGITLDTATAEYVAGTEDSQTGTLGAYPNFVTDEALTAGLNESWTVTATFSIDLALVTAEGNDCDDTNAGAENTGFTNGVTGSSTDTDLTDNIACTEFIPPAISLDKTADVATYDTVGDVINYDYLITNLGPDVLDPGLSSVVDDKETVTCPAAVPLLVGDTVTCTASHVITQADLLAGLLTNVATAMVDDVTSNEDTVTVTATILPPVDPVIAVPVNDRLALLLLTLMLLATGWYFRPAVTRKP